MRITVFYCLLFIFTVTYSITSQQLSSRTKDDAAQRLYAMLANNSNKNVGPWRDNSDSVDIMLDISLYSINDLVCSFKIFQFDFLRKKII